MTILALQPDATAGKDTNIDASATTSNFGLTTTIRAAGPASTSKLLVQFDVSSIPFGAVITSAILTLWSTTSGGVGQSINVQRALTDWFEGDGNNSVPTINGSTWNLRNVIGSVAWGAVGGLSGTDYSATVIATTSVTGAGAFTWDVTSEVEAIVNGGITNRGWWLLNPAGAGRNFRSSDSATTGERPLLTITYEVIGAMVGTSAGTSTTTATIEADGKLVGTVSGAATVTAILISNEFVRANTAGTSTTTASISAIGYMASTVAGISTAVGDIQGEKQIAGSTAGTSTVTGNPKGIFRTEGSAAGTSTVSAIPSFEGQLRGTSSGVASVVGLMWGKAIGVARVIGCNPVPYLYITDGSIKNNGQLNILDFLSEGSGFKLQSWRPQISQYKEGGRFSNGPLAQGRRLRYRNFDNVIETFELSAKSRDQDNLIEYQQELLAWQEAAANYWVSDFALSPVYLVAKAAREMNSRYAIVHMISVPELENPYIQPFYSVDHAVFTAITPRIERGHWLSTPPGQFECVQISSVRSWTVSGWETGV